MNDQAKTKQQLIEELGELRQQLADRRQINDNLPVLVATAGLDGYYKEFNAAFEKILGWSEEESFSRPFMEFIHPEDRAAAAETLGRLIAGDTVINFVIRFLCKNGSHRWFNWIVIPVPNREIVFGIGQDITERKRAEEALRKAHDELEERVKERTSELTAANEALRQSEEKFRSLIEMSPDAVVMCDLTGHITYASRRALQMYGAENVEEMLEKNPLDFFVPGDQQRFLANVQLTLKEGLTRDVPYDFVRKDGTCFAGEASAAAINDMAGKPEGFVAVLRDITLRKRAEESLRQSHDELQAIHDGMVDGLLVTDIETQRLLRANAAICRMLGYSEAELLSLSIRDIHPAEVLPHILGHIRSVEEANHTPVANVPFLRKDGSVFYAEVIGKFLIYDGRPCSMGIFRDVTERLQAQEALERERQSLWNMLQASDHERQIIAYDIHDGLAQYLAAAGMQFQVHDSLCENSPDEARKAYDTAVELVRQAHSESRRLISEVRHPVIDERGLESAILNLVYEQRQRGGQKIDCHSSVDFNRLPPILENALYRMVQEALTNACKHSKSKKVTVSVIQEGEEVRLEVRDWGIGFDTAATEKGHFGLESIRQRTRLLGGQLTIESKPGSGTLVRVVVPIVEKQAEV